MSRGWGARGLRRARGRRTDLGQRGSLQPQPHSPDCVDNNIRYRGSILATADGARYIHRKGYGGPSTPRPPTQPPPSDALTGAPAMVQRSNGETDVVAVARNGAMTFYYNQYGNPTWNPIPITGPQ